MDDDGGDDDDDDDDAEAAGCETASRGCDMVREVPSAPSMGGDIEVTLAPADEAAAAVVADAGRRSCWCGCCSCARVDTGLSGVTSAFATVGNLYAIHQPRLEKAHGMRRGNANEESHD